MKKNNVIVAKRKTTIVNGSIKEGNGEIRINNVKLDAFNDKIFKMIISEPIKLSNNLFKKYDINLTVQSHRSHIEALLGPLNKQVTGDYFFLIILISNIKIRISINAESKYRL